MSSAAYYYIGCEDEHYQQPHFLDTCSLCQRHIFQNSDIFMYRGDTPFCSDECRQEQIEIDEENEKKKKRSSSSSKRSSSLKQSNESVKDSDANKPVLTGSIAVS